FERVAETIGRSYYDETFRTERWPELVAAYEPAARAAEDLDEERAVVDAMLARVPATHLALLSSATHSRLMAELARRTLPTFGFELEAHAGRFFVAAVLEGGPAEAAGVLRGDRVVRIDGEPTGASPRLDRSSDDAHLPDPPRHLLLGEEGDEIVLGVERRPGAPLVEIAVRCAPYSAWAAAQASARTFEVDGHRIGYVHYWYVHLGGVHRHLRDLLAREFAGCAAVVLDLRGRGGDGSAVEPLLRVVRDAARPVVALVDRGTRSAKEVIAFRLREARLATLVGERTAGAVIPATFRRVGKDDVLMYPSFTLGRYTDQIDLVGVEP